MDRGRDRRYDDRGAETYRRSDRNTYNRGNRSPPRRARTPPPFADTYTPGNARPRTRSPRRRSRSPAYRGGEGDSYRGRRSPPRRHSPPRREDRARSPLPRARSPYGTFNRARSPGPVKRGRELSPIDNRRLRSPLPAKRERYNSPVRERYDRRPSPAREVPLRFPRENNYRPHERSRSPIARRPEQISRAVSPISSRRSSPRGHPDRAAIVGSGTHSPAFGNSRGPPVQRSPLYRNRSPRRESRPELASPPRETFRDFSPPRQSREPPPRDRDEYRNGATPTTWAKPAPSGPGYRNGDTRAPPSGPSGPQYGNSYGRGQPPGPPSAPISMSAHNRPSSANLLSAPTRPRGGPGFSRDIPRESHFNGPPPRRGGAPYPQYHGPPSRHHDSRSEGVPMGPRGPPSYDSARPPYDSGRPPYDSGRSSYEGGRPPFRPNNSSSTTYPRTQRFSQHLNNMPTIVSGGKQLPSGLDPVQEKRLAQLEDEKKKLMDAIEEKQKIKRQGLREWDDLERSSRRDGLRSELAEGHLERLSGEGGSGGAAF